MRNGNITFRPSARRATTALESSYEEWKPAPVALLIGGRIPLESSYEEWKQFFHLCGLKPRHWDSYLTRNHRLISQNPVK